MRKFCIVENSFHQHCSNSTSAQVFVNNNFQNIKIVWRFFKQNKSQNFVVIFCDIANNIFEFQRMLKLFICPCAIVFGCKNGKDRSNILPTKLTYFHFSSPIQLPLDFYANKAEKFQHKTQFFQPKVFVSKHFHKPLV